MKQKFVCCKIPSWQQFHIHVAFELAGILLACYMFSVEYVAFPCCDEC